MVRYAYTPIYGQLIKRIIASVRPTTTNTIIHKQKILCFIMMNPLAPFSRGVPSYWRGLMDLNHRMQESKSCALPTWRNPYVCGL